MAAYSSVFKRVEKKYRIGAAERAAVEAAAGGPMAVDAYGHTRITSLYLDTPERSMIARSVEKPLYKEKLRLRAYGDAAGVALMGAFGAGPIVREPGGLPLSDGEVETRVAAGLQVPGAAAALPVFFGIKKKFQGHCVQAPARPDVAAALAFVSGLPYEQACARWPAVGCGACGCGALAGHAPDRPRVGGGHGPLVAPGAVHGYRLRSCGLGLPTRDVSGAGGRRAVR